MNINKIGLSTFELERLSDAELLQVELIKQGFMTSRIIKSEDRSDYKVVFFDGTHDYIVGRDYNKNVTISRYNQPRYKNVSSHVNNETYKKTHTSNNVKIITATKLQKLLDNVRAYHVEMERLEIEAQGKIKSFLATLKDLSVVYHKEDRENSNSDITSGEIVKNGIDFSFDICHDGYISKKISIDYKVENDIPSFLKLSDNKY